MCACVHKYMRACVFCIGTNCNVFPRWKLQIVSASTYVEKRKYVCVYIYFSLLLFLVCISNPTSNYTLLLNVSSRVLVRDGNSNYVLAGEEVTLIATTYNNSSNFTDSNNQSQVYYNFQCSNVSTGYIWYHINCSEGSTAMTIWHTGGKVECSVQLLTQDDDMLACNATQIVIAGNVLIQCKITMLYNSCILFLINYISKDISVIT